MSSPSMEIGFVHFLRCAVAPAVVDRDGQGAWVAWPVRGGGVRGVVRRHGAMVLRVCRRLLNDTHEAEDVFQAHLPGAGAAGGGGSGNRDSVASWPYGVAYRVSLTGRHFIGGRAVSGSKFFKPLTRRQKRRGASYGRRSTSSRAASSLVFPSR